MSKPAIYLDYMATTPVDERVIDTMIRYLGCDGVYGNPASMTHDYGRQAADAIESARADIAAVIGANARDVIFTSGATEADNLAILGAARFYQRKGKHLITMTTEHQAVLDSFRQLECEGFEVSYLAPDSQGLLSLDTLSKAIRSETILLSVMHVNNEIGVIQNIDDIGHLIRGRGIVFHVDAAQSAGRVAINLHQLPVDLMSFSAHKLYGPKGIGALYVRQKPRIRLQPMSFGGGHENGLRSGTLATHQIVGMAHAFVLAEQLRVSEQARLLTLRQQLWDGIKDLKGIRLNGHPNHRVAGNLNISFAGIDDDSLLLALHELAVSKTSACASASHAPSYVLKALGLDDQLAHSSLRLSLGRFTTDEQIKIVIAIICHQINSFHDKKLG